MNWLTGCQKENKFFCWPCILFSTEKNVWRTSGFNDLNNFHKAVDRHGKKSSEHLKSVLALSKFGTGQRIENLLDSHYKSSIIKHNELVKKNRNIIKIFIDVVCHLACQEQAFRGHRESQDSVNRGNYVELISLLAKYNPELKNHLDTASVFSGLSNYIQNDLIMAISSILTKKITSEIQNSEFVAIICDETTDISCRSMLSTTLRYISSSGDTKETFISFKNISDDRRAARLHEHVVHVMQSFACGSKLICQSYDGASVMAGEVSGLQTRVKETFPNALFVHCLAHRLNLVLSKSCDKIRECRIFFQSITGFSNFFSHSTKRTAVLDSFLKRRLPKVAHTRWNFNGRLILSIHDNIDNLSTLFEYITDNEEDIWDVETVNSARGLSVLLNNFQFVFLLKMFSKIFPQTDILFEIFQSKQSDISFCTQKIRDFQTQLQNLRNNFTNVWEETSLICEPTQQRKRPRSIVDGSENIELSFKRLFAEIIDILNQEIVTRFSSLNQLRFLELFNTSKFRNYANKFPDDLLQNLDETYPKLFDKTSLKTELTVLFSDEDLNGKAFQEIFRYFVHNSLQDSFIQSFKLLKLILTLPVTSASAERSFSTLKRILTFSRNATSEERLSDLALITIEKSLLKTLLSHEDFYNEIIDEFAIKERRIELKYKF